MSENRDDSSGQFTPSTEGLFGREHELVSAGFTVKKDPPSDEKTYGSDDASLREAANDLAESRPPPLDLSVSEFMGERDPKEALTVEQAGEELATARGNLTKFVEGVDLSALADQTEKNAPR